MRVVPAKKGPASVAPARKVIMFNRLFFCSDAEASLHTEADQVAALSWLPPEAAYKEIVCATTVGG